MNPQAALDAPRWQWLSEKTIAVEQTFPSHIAKALEEKGHDVKVMLDVDSSYGRGQIILRDPDSGVLIGGTEPRTDGAISVW